MFEQLFLLPAVARRHREGPAVRERLAFLDHCARQGFARIDMRRLAQGLLAVATYLDVEGSDRISLGQVRGAALRWSRRPRRGGWQPPSRRSAWTFGILARRWCRFLGRLDVPPPPHAVFAAELDAYVAHMRDERGFAAITIQCRKRHAAAFLDHFAAARRPLEALTATDVDAFIVSLPGRGRGWCRVSVATAVKQLRPFLRYGDEHRWWPVRISDALVQPHIHREEQLPIGPSWPDVERLLACASGTSPRDVRDAAILRLLAVYGLRASEVAGLRLDDIDWERERLTVARAKSRRCHTYPLVPSVAAAILSYLESARPATAHREVFLTLLRPWRPINSDCVYHVVNERLCRLGITYPRHLGAHALRHACAARLVSEGLSLKEIGDHLGHRSAFATRTYAKIGQRQL